MTTTTPLSLRDLDALAVDKLRGVGGKKRDGLAVLGIDSVLDLLFHYPRRYVDRTREARKYANPIPSREFILETLTQAGVPLVFDELRQLLELDSEEDRIALERRLGAMVRDGQLGRNRKDAFCLVNRRDLIVGRVIGHQDGFGFLIPDEGGDDVYLVPRQMRALFHHDRAVVRVTGRDARGRLEGSVVEILARNTRTVVGRFYRELSLIHI